MDPRLPPRAALARARRFPPAPAAALALTLLLAGAAGLAALMLCLPSPAWAQEAAPGGSPPPEDAEVFGEVIEVRVVNVEAVVVGRDGKRVTGPRLLVDGKPARIDYFTEVAGGRAAQEESGVASPGAGGGQPAAVAGTVYDTRLELTRIKQDVVIGLYDPPSGRVLATTTRVEP